MAVRQAEIVSSRLSAIGIDTEIIRISSEGDRDTSTPLHIIGGTGVFVEEINRKVMEGYVDIAVHSAKDLPYRLPSGLQIMATMPRDSPRDALISKYDLKSLPAGSVIGTSSIRRTHELQSFRNDLKVKNIRGNLDTRIKKLEEGQYDGIIVAEAGLERLKSDLLYQVLSEDDFLPSPNQGIIAVVGKSDSLFGSEIRRISDKDTQHILDMERKVVAGLHLGCSLPAAVLCSRTSSGYRIRCRFYSTSSREYKEFTRIFSDEMELDSLVSDIRRKVPQSYGYNFGTE